MLVLTRKTEQKIHIGRDITVTILRIKGRSVKIGIEAPSGKEVLRGELLNKQPPSREPASERLEPRGQSSFSPTCPWFGAGLPTSP